MSAVFRKKPIYCDTALVTQFDVELKFKVAFESFIQTDIGLSWPDKWKYGTKFGKILLNCARFWQDREQPAT